MFRQVARKKLTIMAIAVSPSQSKTTFALEDDARDDRKRELILEERNSDQVLFQEPEMSSLPQEVQERISELDQEYKEGEITDKGYKKRKSAILAPYLMCYSSLQESFEVDEEKLIEPPESQLPLHIKTKLTELKQELDDEEITEKGFRKRRLKIMTPYLLKEPPIDSLPMKIRDKLEELDNELAEGDITTKGHKKKRTKLLSPFLLRAFQPTKPRKSEDLPSMVVGEDSEVEEPIAMEITNKGEKMFKCQLCNEVFKQAQSFSGHCKLHRDQRSKKYQCSICSLSYTTPSHLKFHMYKHTGNFPYTCEHCGKGFAGRSQYRYHVLRHSGKTPYVCKLCGGRFWKKNSLVAHTQRHKKVIDLFTQCKCCQRVFQTGEELLLHLESHRECSQDQEPIFNESNVMASKDTNPVGHGDEIQINIGQKDVT